MNVEYLIQLLENKLTALTNAKAQAFAMGDLVTINSLDVEISGVNDTLYKLRLLLTATQAAAMTNTAVSEMITAGVTAAQNASTLLSNPTACMNEYDISTYASDPLHEQKIADILQTMGAMDTAAQIDAYLNKEVVGSPLTGQMIYDAAQKYAVDCRLTMALMELDSRFGTVGVAISTLNPGNVGNTGSSTQTYASWTEGVEAVAAWLSRHRKTVVVPEVKSEVVVPVVPEVVTPVVPVVPPPPIPVAMTTSTPTPVVVPTEVITTPTSTPATTDTSTTTISNTDTSTSSPTSTLQQVIENIISPTSTDPIATSTAESVASTVVDSVATEAATTTVESATTTSI